MTNFEFFEKLAEEKEQCCRERGHDDEYKLIVSNTDYPIAVIKHIYLDNIVYEIYVIDFCGFRLARVRSFINEESAMNAFKAFTAVY